MMSMVRRPMADREESGFSLPELIIAMGLLSIVMTLVVTFFVTFSTTFTKERAATDSTNVAAVGMNVITKVIRAGTIIDLKTLPDLSVFVKADDESVILHSYLADDAIDPEPVLIELSIDSDRELIESRWNPTKVSEGWSFPNALSSPQPTPATSRVVARKIISPPSGASPLFTYLDENGTALSTPVTGADLKKITAVRVSMIVQADETERAAPVELRSRVGIPNLTASRLGASG